VVVREQLSITSTAYPCKIIYCRYLNTESTLRYMQFKVKNAEALQTL